MNKHNWIPMENKWEERCMIHTTGDMLNEYLNGMTDEVFKKCIRYRCGNCHAFTSVNIVSGCENPDCEFDTLVIRELRLERGSYV